MAKPKLASTHSEGMSRRQAMSTHRCRTQGHASVHENIAIDQQSILDERTGFYHPKSIARSGANALLQNRSLELSLASGQDMLHDGVHLSAGQCFRVASQMHTQKYPLLSIAVLLRIAIDFAERDVDA